jgi:hypothetical protein
LLERDFHKFPQSANDADTMMTVTARYSMYFKEQT